MKQKVVTSPLKVDLHIHSFASKHKDGSKVEQGTIDNISTLVEKLEAHEVNVAAITDHDCFNYELYETLSNYSNAGRHLEKVLPGVEFSVMFEVNDVKKPVHIITIFNDANQNAVKSIETVLKLEDNKPKYDEHEAFSEDYFWKIIREIGLDIITIAHQKNSLDSSRKRANDANSVGEEAFNEFLFMEYFEAYEYKNRKNELFNKNFIYKCAQPENLRLITGSDCHQWGSYPGVDASSIDDMPFTYLKCLPTFRGLAMAVTDSSRIKTVNSFFSSSTKSIPSLDLCLAGKEVQIPLSPGINAIIGDNSVGKSSIVNSLASFPDVKNLVKQGQQKYLEKKGVVIRNKLPEKTFLRVDSQEAIRKTFEDLQKSKIKSHLDAHFPDQIDSTPCKTYINTQIRLLCNSLTASINHQASLEGLSKLKLPSACDIEKPRSIVFKRSTLQVEEAVASRALINEIDTVLAAIDQAEKVYPQIISEDDKKDFTTARNALSRIKKRHSSIVDRRSLESKVANVVDAVMREEESRINKIATDSQKQLAAFSNQITKTSKAIIKAIELKTKIKPYTFNFNSYVIEPSTNEVGNLIFISKLASSQIGPKELKEAYDAIFKVNTSIDMEAINARMLRDAIKNYPDDKEDPVDVVKNKLESAVDKLLAPINSINRSGDNIYDELSQGFNAQIYFYLLSDRSLGDGVYAVDQPEDQISQKAIKNSVLNEFREIASARQVILITHNPQFIINLDVDNVIHIGRSESGLIIESGALEYECNDYKILEVVAENVEGGLDAVKRRMKRYEKSN